MEDSNDYHLVNNVKNSLKFEDNEKYNELTDLVDKFLNSNDLSSKNKKKLTNEIMVLFNDDPVINSNEPILQYDSNRFTSIPKYKKLWKLYKEHVASFWTVEEIDLSKDYKDLEKMQPNEKKFLFNILAFFLKSDRLVNDNLIERFLKEVQILEGQNFYGFQVAMENIHSEMYSLLIQTYIKDETKKQKFLNGVENISCVKKKSDWIRKWFKSDSPFVQRVVAFAAVEGIFFSGSFCAIFWLKKRGWMPGLTLSNEFISRDEGLHMKFACALYSFLNKKLTTEVVHELIKDAVEIEKEFIIDTISVKMIGMNSTLMSQYIEYVADRLLFDLGHPKLYESENPFPFMNLQGMVQKTNFFESRVSSYQISNVMSKNLNDNKKSDSYSFSEDF